MPFQYTFRSIDLESVKSEDRDLLENRDRELELYLNQATLKLTGAVYSVGSGTTTDWTFIAETVDTDGMIAVPSATITIRQTGLYALGASVLSSQSGDIQVFLFVDGLEQNNFTITRTLANPYDPVFLSANLYLNAGQLVKVRVKNVSISPNTNFIGTLAMTRLMA